MKYPIDGVSRRLVQQQCTGDVLTYHINISSFLFVVLSAPEGDYRDTYQFKWN